MKCILCCNDRSIFTHLFTWPISLPWSRRSMKHNVLFLISPLIPPTQCLSISCSRRSIKHLHTHTHTLQHISSSYPCRYERNVRNCRVIDRGNFPEGQQTSKKYEDTQTVGKRGRMKEWRIRGRAEVRKTAKKSQNFDVENRHSTVQ